MTPPPLVMPKRRRWKVCAECFGTGRTFTTRVTATGSEVADYNPCGSCTGPRPVIYEEHS